MLVTDRAAQKKRGINHAGQARAPMTNVAGLGSVLQCLWLLNDGEGAAWLSTLCLQTLLRHMQ
jgi:hypothetical protein